MAGGSKAVKAAAEDTPGLREALRRPVIRRTVEQRWDPEAEVWVNETKTSEVGIGPVGALVLGAVALGAVSAVATGLNEAAKRREAQNGPP